MAYQGSSVGVEAVGTRLVINDLYTGKKIAEHKIHHGKGQTIKNNHHYRDLSKRIEELEGQIGKRLGEELESRICKLLRITSPTIYKDQLFGLLKVLSGYQEIDLEVMERLSDGPRLTVTRIKDYLEAYAISREVAERASFEVTEALTRYAAIGGGHAIH